MTGGRPLRSTEGNTVNSHNLNIECIDVCFVDYLQDHHNRPGEALVGVSVTLTEDEALANLIEGVCELDAPEFDTDEVNQLAELAVSHVDWAERTEVESVDTDGEDEAPEAWFLVTWEKT
jgi:hypothetical protein